MSTDNKIVQFVNYTKKGGRDLLKLELKVVEHLAVKDNPDSVVSWCDLNTSIPFFNINYHPEITKYLDKLDDIVADSPNVLLQVKVYFKITSFGKQRPLNISFTSESTTLGIFNR